MLGKQLGFQAHNKKQKPKAEGTRLGGLKGFED